MTTQLPMLKAHARTAAGKSAARRLRREGFVPAIAYGHDLPSTAISVPPKEVAALLRSEHGKNTVFELEFDGKKLVAMIRDYALHPLKRELEHVDFIEVKLDKPVDVQVPLFATGKAVGVTKGGILRIVHRSVPVRCVPDRIPVKLEADVTRLELGQHIATQDLTLPEGVSVRLPPEQTLIAVVAPEKEVEEAAPGAPAAGAAPAGGSVAPPAGGAQAAAPAEGAAGKAAPAKDDKKKK